VCGEMDGTGAHIMTSPTDMAGMVGLKRAMCRVNTKHSNKLGMVYIEKCCSPINTCMLA
jgi:hypothetical protein